jgi:hypothetical protein
MTAVSVLRELWSRRLLVAVGLALALIVATLMAFSVRLGVPPDFESRQYNVGIASAAVLIDSPSSQVADLGGGGETGPQADVSTLSARARLLANLMSTSPLKDRIATRAGIHPNTLIARAPVGEGITPEPTPLSTGATISEDDPRANILTITVNETLPILAADSQAASAAQAARISSAAVAELPLYLRSVASTDRVPNAQQLVVKPLGTARYTTVQRGPRRLFAAAAAIVLFGLWCVGILFVTGFARAWRQASDSESGVDPAGPKLERDAPSPPDMPIIQPPATRARGAGPDVPALPERPELPWRPERPERPERNRGNKVA